MTYTLGTSNRTQTVKGQYVDPVQHVATSARYSRTGRTVRALCGRAVMARGVPFNPDHSRACAECLAAIKVRES